MILFWARMIVEMKTEGMNGLRNILEVEYVSVVECYIRWGNVGNAKETRMTSRFLE